jgi:hypothetical protein
MHAHPWSVLLAGLVMMGIGSSGRPADPVPDPDLTYAEKTLRKAGRTTDGPALIKFFQERTLSEAGRKDLVEQIQLLGNERYRVRRQAYRRLQAAGRAALPFVRAARAHRDPEIAALAELLFKEVESGSDQLLTVAAARVMAARRPAGAVKVLLDYLPQAGDENIEEAVMDALADLGRRAEGVDPLVTAALRDPEAIRRLAGTYVHGKVKTGRPGALKPLLADADPRVRFQAAAGLMRDGEKSAVPVLIALLEEKGPGPAWQAEDLLLRLAGDQAPVASLGNSAEEQKKCREQWAAWWQAHEARIDLARIRLENAFRGLTLVCDCDTGMGLGARLWECGADGRERWHFAAARTVVDAQLLPGGRLLIAEGHTNLVSERTRTGKLLWSHQTNGYATTAQRLPNGNTLMAGYGEITEVTPQGKAVFSWKSQGSIYRVQRQRNGNLVFATNGRVMELDRTGKEIRNVPIPGGTGIWAHADRLPNGRYLVALYSAGQVIELDTAGKVHWKVSVRTPSSASRLPNGNILVSAMDDRRMVEFNREGKEVWTKPTKGRPFLVRRY